MSEKKQTAVEWLALELYEKMQMKGDGNIFDDILNKALQMEREQIEEAHGDDYNDTTESVITGSQYYTDTYGE